ncbi:kinase-like domain-containing protein [Piptocephalis cylindrospora]|uniref:non-specific serine/threonine protein kinase n=1 Tax=Piptocephalis cylindrospora TaxID=1907219 RepID=A0A4P9Y3Q2_9FUNG|nr:kinase-like domain-containing protein [Piptocephalis cylindrospora]|eukprot:RKP13515.1 kinase-like domain-containing protein [Piptocephalis cylindrospora]
MIHLIHTFPQLADRYCLIGKLGEGTFSSVYKAKDVHHWRYDNSAWKEGDDVAASANDEALRRSRRTQEQAQYVAIKRVYVSASPDRVANEVAILRDLRGVPNVTSVITALRHQDQVCVILPYHPHDDFRIFYRRMTLNGVRDYIQALLISMREIHQRGIIHRDVKPANFLYNRQTRRGYLVDFGLAHREVKDPQVRRLARERYDSLSHLYWISPEYAHPRTQSAGYILNDDRPHAKANRAGTRGFRAPEILMKQTYQTVSIDVWSVGVILLCILTGRFPFFQSNTDAEALIELACIFGVKGMKRCAALNARSFECSIPTLNEDPISMESLCRALNKDAPWCTSSGGPSSASPKNGKEGKKQTQSTAVFSLLQGLLTLNPWERLTAADALAHPFFQEGVDPAC